MKNKAFAKAEPAERSLYEESWDWLGEIILSHEVECMSSPDPEMERDAEIFFRNANDKHLKLIHRQLRRLHLRRSLRFVIPQAFHVMVMIIGILALTAGIAYAANPQIRNYVTRLVVETNPEYTSIRIERETGASSVPEGWKGSCYPSFVPDGLVLGSMFCDANNHYVAYCYAGSGEPVFTFEEIVNGSVGIDTEGAECEGVFVHGFSAQAVIKDNHVTIYWEESERLMIVYLRGGTLDLAVECAEGIHPVK